MTARTSRVLGALLLGVAALGFVTVADDLRPAGETAAVAAVLLSGAELFLSGQYPQVGSYLFLPWVPVGLLAGMTVGTVFDHAVIGFALGLALGLVLARVARRGAKEHDVTGR